MVLRAAALAASAVLLAALAPAAFGDADETRRQMEAQREQMEEQREQRQAQQEREQRAQERLDRAGPAAPGAPAELGAPAEPVAPERDAAAAEPAASGCAEGTVPITRNSDQAAACVFPGSFDALVQRGWGY